MFVYVWESLCGGLCLFQGFQVHLCKHIGGNVSGWGLRGQGGEHGVGWGVQKEVVPVMRKIWIPVCKTN